MVTISNENENGLGTNPDFSPFSKSGISPVYKLIQFFFLSHTYFCYDFRIFKILLCEPAVETDTHFRTVSLTGKDLPVLLSSIAHCINLKRLRQEDRDE